MIQVCGKLTRHGYPCQRPRARGKLDCGHDDHAAISTLPTVELRPDGRLLMGTQHSWVEHFVGEQPTLHSIVQDSRSGETRLRSRLFARRGAHRLIFGDLPLATRPIELTRHAVDRMEQRHISMADIHFVLQSGARRTAYGVVERWEGTDSSGRPLAVVAKPLSSGPCGVITAIDLREPDVETLIESDLADEVESVTAS